MTPPFSTDAAAFSAKLKSARLRSGKSQERIAGEVGTSRRHYIRWENGEHVPSHAYVNRIAKAVGKPVSYFADEAQREQQESESDGEGRPMGLSREEMTMLGELSAKVFAATLMATRVAS